MERQIENPIVRLIVASAIAFSLGIGLHHANGNELKDAQNEQTCTKRVNEREKKFDFEDLRIVETKRDEPWKVVLTYGCAINDCTYMEYRRGTLDDWYAKLKRGNGRWSKPNRGAIVNLSYYTEYLTKKQCQDSSITGYGDGGLTFALVGIRGEICTSHLVPVSRHLAPDFIHDLKSIRNTAPQCDCDR